MSCAEIRLLGVAGVILASVLWCWVGYWLGKRGRKEEKRGATPDTYQEGTLFVHDEAGEGHTYLIKRRVFP